jgi:hypothetical protein
LLRSRRYEKENHKAKHSCEKIALANEKVVWFSV